MKGQRGRTVVLLDPNFDDTSAIEAAEMHRKIMDVRHGPEAWSGDDSLSARLTEIWHNLLHPFGLHWRMPIELIDMRGGDVKSQSLGVRCALCEIPD